MPRRVLERGISGRATALVAPFGQRTALTFDANGFLAAVSNPANEAIDFTYSADGLLQTMRDPKRKTYQYSFDPLGRLTKDEDPLHGFTSLARTDNATGSTVTKSTAMGRTTTYRTESLPLGGTKTTVTALDGAVSTSVTGTNGTRTETSADGTVSTSLREPDARSGMQSPAETSVSVRTPAGLTSTTTSARGDTSDEIELVLNSDVDGPVVLGLKTFYYGFDALDPAKGTSLVAVAVHEILHGLGFATVLERATGAKLAGLDDIFEIHLERTGAIPPDFPSMTDAQRLAAITSAPDVAAASTLLTSGVVAGGKIEMYAPGPAPTPGGLAHFSSGLAPFQAMEEFYGGIQLDLRLARAVLADLGWGPGPDCVTIQTGGSSGAS